jgi:hypothetical protein
MNNRHERKFFTNMLIGLTFTTAGIISIVYFSHDRESQLDWIFWTFIPVIAINTGLLFISSGIVHKVKADFIRKQKQKESRSEKLD